MINALTEKEMEDSGTTVLRRVQRILRSEGQWHIRYAPREKNLVAGRMIKLSQSNMEIKSTNVRRTSQ